MAPRRGGADVVELRALAYPPRAGRSRNVAALALVVRALRGVVYQGGELDPGASLRAAGALAGRFRAVLEGLEGLAAEHPRKGAALLSFERVCLAAAEAIETPGAGGFGRSWVALAVLVAWTAGEGVGDRPPAGLPVTRSKPRGAR